MLTTKTSLIIGNGLSRKGLSLDALPLGLETWGCNAIVREFLPNYVVAIDPLPIWEIMSLIGETAWDRFVPTAWDDQFEPYEASGQFRPRNNAGMVAMKKAIERDAGRLLMVGMDFAILNQSINEGNIFDGTNGYGPETRCSFNDTANRWKFMEWFAKQNPHVDFVFLFKGTYPFRKTNVPNIRIVTIENWEEINGYCN